MKKAGRYVTAMIAAVLALNFASFTAAEEVFTEEAAMELPMVETTVELPIEEEIAAPAPEMPVEEEVAASAPEMPVQEEAAAPVEDNNADLATVGDAQNEAASENTEAIEAQNTVSVPENVTAEEITEAEDNQADNTETVEEEIEVQNDPADVTIDAEEENTEDNTEEAEETEEHEVEEISKEESEESIEEALDPDRYVEIQLSWGDEEAAVGSTAHFTAVLHGYENVKYTLQWQHSTDSENWENVENATDGTYSVVATKENCHDTWRVKVVITGTEA